MALRGDVHWARLKAPVGRRPVVVVQNNVGNRYSPSTIVVVVSTSPPPGDYPFLVALDAAVLGEPCWVHCETILTVPQDLLDGRLGALAANDVARLDAALKKSLALK